MDFSVNPKILNKIFAVPSAVVDDNIRLAGAAQLKVLLWYLRNSDNLPSVDKASGALGISKGDINDALLYWFDTGVFIKNSDADSTIEIQTEKPEYKTRNIEKPVVENIKPPIIIPQSKKPTVEEVIKRGNEDKDIKYLLNQAQVIFGRTLRNDELSTFVWLADYAGLPVAVILMGIEFSVNRGRGGVRYIEKMLLSWSDEEILTVKDADKKISQILSCEKIWYKLEKLFGIEDRKPTKKEEELVDLVRNRKISKELLAEAYELSVNSKGKYSPAYILGIAKKWIEQGIKKPEDIKNKKPGTAPSKDTTLDISEYERIALDGPKLRKKKTGDQ